MFYLKDEWTSCSFENGRLIPCEYHKNRCNTKIFKLSDNSGEYDGISNQVVHKRTDDIIELSRLFNREKDPTGGWFLVQEHREWLELRFKEKFKKMNGKKCKILIAGVASYIHFYTNLRIIFSAATEVQFPIENLIIHVIDKCIFPIYQISELDNILRNKLFVSKQISIFGYKLKISRETRYFLKEMKSQVKKINLKLYIADLQTSIPEDFSEKYDVITEHFLTSMQKNNLQSMSKIRKLYKNILSKEALLLASSKIKDDKYLSSYVKIHAKNGLTIKNDKTVRAWDPYSLNIEELKFIEYNEDAKLVAPLIDYLFTFTKQ